MASPSSLGGPIRSAFAPADLCPSVRSRTTIVCAAAALVAALAVIVPVMKGNGAYSPAPHFAAASGQSVAHNLAKVELDPIDDNSIIIECVALGNHLIAAATDREPASKSRLAGVPILPLGPSACWPQDQN
jgi:hypothetical protein